MGYKDEEPGQIEVLGDRYLLQNRIGRGGMSTIYRARDLQMDRAVAVKVLREVYSTDPKFVKRFQREARAASALKHPNIMPFAMLTAPSYPSCHLYLSCCSCLLLL